MRGRLRCGWRTGCPSGGRTCGRSRPPPPSRWTTRPPQPIWSRWTGTYDDFLLLEVTDLTGKVLASSRPAATVDLAGQDWFGTAAGGRPVTTSLVQRGDHIQWVIAQPIAGGTGQPRGVVIGELNPAALATLLNAQQDEGSVVVAVDAQHQLIYDTAMGEVADDTALLAAGALHTTVDNAATQHGEHQCRPRERPLSPILAVRT